MQNPLHQITFEFSSHADESAIQEPAMHSSPESTTKDSKIKKPERPKIKLPSTRGRKSLKDMGLEAELVEIPEDSVLFQKQYYPIGEVAAMFRVNPSLLRFWETEFDIIQPRKNRKGDRYFRPQDIKNLELIYDLLRRRKFTIEGAKDWFRKNKNAEEKFAAIQSLERIKAFLLEIKSSL